MSSASTPEWFYLVRGQEHGPITSSELRDLAASGRLSPSDSIRRTDMAAPVPASRVKGLFPSAKEDASAHASQKNPEPEFDLRRLLQCEADLPPSWSLGDFISLPKMFEELEPARVQEYLPFFESGSRKGGVAGLVYG